MADEDNNSNDSHWAEERETQQLLHAANSFMSDAKRF